MFLAFTSTIIQAPFYIQAVLSLMGGAEKAKTDMKTPLNGSLIGRISSTVPAGCDANS